MTHKLFPCPFCGSSAAFADDGEGGNWIECSQGTCGASTNIRYSMMDDCKVLLVQQWNRRSTTDDDHPLDNDAAVAAIAFALEEASGDLDGIEFLRCWNEGDFDSVRDQWPEAPEEVFIGADPLYRKKADDQEVNP